MTTNKVTFDIIGHISSPFKEKFAIPRQPGLVGAANGQVLLADKSNNIELVKGLEQFSHIWLLFVFHESISQGWKPLVRPPRLGGNKKIGVLATRSPFRPNPIGMSVVKLKSIEVINKQVILNISGLDLLDQTPIVDVKPYVPYSDALPYAEGGFAQYKPEHQLTVSYTDNAKDALNIHCKEYPSLAQLIEQILIQDPRPAYKQNKADEKLYGMSLYDFNIEWRMLNVSTVEVTSILKISNVEGKGI